MNRKEFFKGLIGVGVMSIVPDFLQAQQSDPNIPTRENLIKDGWIAPEFIDTLSFGGKELDVIYTKENVCLYMENRTNRMTRMTSINCNKGVYSVRIMDDYSPYKNIDPKAATMKDIREFFKFIKED